MYYAGIGSRQTPLHILTEMTSVAAKLEKKGFTLRSGGAAGADSAFEQGVIDPSNAQIFLPWRNFNHNPSALYDPREEAFEMASQYHPAWNRCSPAAKKFHARNCYQMLGLDLNTPSAFVMCWTPGAAVTGGTGQALRIAHDHDIPVFNMADPQWKGIASAWWSAVGSKA
jgi:hypothetical protein